MTLEQLELDNMEDQCMLAKGCLKLEESFGVPIHASRKVEN